MLPVDIRQVRSQLPQQRRCYRPAADKCAGFAAGQDLTLDQEFAIFQFEAGWLQQPAKAACSAPGRSASSPSA